MLSMAVEDGWVSIAPWNWEREEKPWFIANELVEAGYAEGKQHPRGLRLSGISATDAGRAALAE